MVEFGLEVVISAKFKNTPFQSRKKTRNKFHIYEMYTCSLITEHVIDEAI